MSESRLSLEMPCLSSCCGVLNGLPPNHTTKHQCSTAANAYSSVAVHCSKRTAHCAAKLYSLSKSSTTTAHAVETQNTSSAALLTWIQADMPPLPTLCHILRVHHSLAPDSMEASSNIHPTPTSKLPCGILRIYMATSLLILVFCLTGVQPIVVHIYRLSQMMYV